MNERLGCCLGHTDSIGWFVRGQYAHRVKTRVRTILYLNSERAFLRKKKAAQKTMKKEKAYYSRKKLRATNKREGVRQENVHV